MEQKETRKPKGKSEYWTKEEWATYMRNYRSKNKQRVNENAKRYRTTHEKELRDRNKNNYIQIKREVLIHYSQGKLQCACCKIKHMDFLTLDHINGDGRKHAEEIGASGSRMYRWAKKNNFPLIFQVLCYNCNCNKRTKPNCDCPFDYSKPNNSKSDFTSSGLPTKSERPPLVVEI